MAVGPNIHNYALINHYHNLDSKFPNFVTIVDIELFYYRDHFAISHIPKSILKLFSKTLRLFEPIEKDNFLVEIKVYFHGVVC
jgi:hypothetical protein